MADILRAAKAVPGFLDQLEVVLIEASPALRAVQQQMLAGCGVPVRWQAQFGHGLDERPLFLAANEFFDALPLRQYVKTGRGWCERMARPPTPKGASPCNSE